MFRALAIVVLAATVLGARPQQPTFRSRTDLVEVDVVVVDAGGNPVTGLSAKDFVVRDRGKDQSIATFEEVSHLARTEAARPLPLIARKDVSNNQTAQSDRLVVMVVDDLHIWKDRTDRAKEIARKVLTDLGAESSMAILFTSGQHSTQVTDDQVVLSAAVETLKGRQSWRRPHVATDKMTGARIDPEAGDPIAIVNANQDAKAQDFFDNMTQYKLLQDAARMLGGSDKRRKAFVLLSEGIGKELSGLFGAMAPPGEAPQGGTAYAAGNVAGLTKVGPPPYHDDALINMMESLRRSNVATYAIDPRGKVESKDLARECFPAPHPGVDPCSEGLTDWVSVVRQAQHGLEIMSEASGGFAVTNTDDFTSGLSRIVGDLDHYYLLGFYPADTKGKSYRPIDVRIPGRPDLRLRFRRGYMPGGPPGGSEAARKGGEMMALAAGVLPKTDLPLRLAAVPAPGSGSTARVLIVLEVTAPRAHLEERDGKLRDTLKYEVLVVDEKKARVRSLGGLEAAFVLSPQTNRGAAPDVATYQVTEMVDVPPGHYEFRVSASSAKLAKGGSVYLPVDVPDFQSAAALGGLIIGYADGAHVPIAPRRLAPARTAARIAGETRPALPIPPSLDRAFTTADTVRVYLEGIWRVPGARPTVSVDVVDRSGKVVRSPSPSFMATDVVKIESVIPLAGLPAGSYVLRATMTNGASPAAVREAGFVIR